jgi:hypothetical protein
MWQPEWALRSSPVYVVDTPLHPALEAIIAATLYGHLRCAEFKYA